MKFLWWSSGARHEFGCQEAREHLSELLEEQSELTPELRRRIQQHLEECPPCTGFFSTLRATVRALRGLPDQETPKTLRQALRSQGKQQ